MIDEQRLAELPTYSRMAWSSRPVWDRRPTATQRRHYREDLAVARRHRRGDVGRIASWAPALPMARPESLVTDVAKVREEFS
jgi:hypothetical protein